MADSKRRTYRNRSGFGDNAPPNTMPFPKTANFTAIELLAFFPNTVYCADVIYRMISNGGTRRCIHAIVNTHRKLEAEWSANCCGEAMYKTMQKAGYTDWTIKKHDLWHASQKTSWDETSLGVGDFRTASVMPTESVSFKSLAVDVRKMPEGEDALDLTRMIWYCVQNLEDRWQYPQDYEELLNLLGGPVKVREENTDRAVFRRWEDRKPPPPLLEPTQPLQGIELPDGWKKTREKRSVGRSGSQAKSESVSPEPTSPNKRAAARGNARKLEEAADIDETEQPEPDGKYGTPYARHPAEYVPPPPPGMACVSAISDLAQVFRSEGAVGEHDPYGAYAFGGPRSIPPYRYLNQIAQPQPWDISGWAENLRWAFEQRILFGQSLPGAARWNESPEHMARIECERTQRIWASDELLEQLLEGD